MSDPRRHIPSVDALLASEAVRRVCERYPRGRVVEALRAEVDALRLALGDGGSGPTDPSDPDWFADRICDRLRDQDTPSLRPVINATGVVLHTNLGRAPLAAEAVEAMARAATGYTNLEYDVGEGRRGSRYVHCVDLLRELTGAEDALVVNNCAAALMLALNTVAVGRGVVVSRGELVEIGGGFRVPEVMERSGARLVEVGSTNRTRLADYRSAAAADDVAALLKVHRSNFRVSGFTEDVGLDALVALGAEVGVPVIYDLGSGLLDDPEALGLPAEPRAPEAVAAGADVVAISGDKLLGGPQAGILVGRRATVEALRRNPMCRALRVDKVTLAGLAATLALYRDPEGARRSIPVLRMLSTLPEVLEGRARSLAAALGQACPGRAAPGDAAVGGGTYPEVVIPSWTVRIASGAPDALAAALRAGEPVVVGRIEGGEVVLDLRTVDPADDDALADAVLRAAGDAPA